MTLPLRQNIYRMECEIGRVDLLQWLAGHAAEPKFYWSDRDGDFRWAGIGVVDRVQGKSLHDLPDALSRIRQKLNGFVCSGADQRTFSYWGGVAFNDRCCQEEWNEFGAYDFVLPRVEIRQDQDRTILAINSLRDDLTSADLDRWKTMSEVSASEMPSAFARVERPSFETWDRTLSRVFDDLDAQIYQKIVLARCVTYEFGRPPDPLMLLRRLMRHSINSYAFLWMPGAGRAFAGVTPERLFERSGRRVRSEAVAGTIPRGQSAQEDLSLEKELLQSLKNESEHRFVVDYLLKAFRGFCQEYSYDKTIKLLKLADNQHLLTKFEGLLKPDVTDDMLIRALHPTPAVGGFPRESAVAKILSYEPFHRGWFTGLVGHVGVENTELAVAIRSGLITGSQLHVYAGAGIVEGSEAAEEWEEIDGKMKPWLRILEVIS